MNVLTSITVLGFLIFFHEMGHFLAAILQGIYVDGFSIGFGPSIIKKKYKVQKKGSQAGMGAREARPLVC